MVFAEVNFLLSSLRGFAQRLSGSSESLRAGVLRTAVGIYLDMSDVKQGGFSRPARKPGLEPQSRREKARRGKSVLSMVFAEVNFPLSSLRGFAQRLCGSSESLRAGVLRTAVGIYLDMSDVKQGGFSRPARKPGLEPQSRREKARRGK